MRKYMPVARVIKGREGEIMCEGERNRRGESEE